MASTAGELFSAIGRGDVAAVRAILDADPGLAATRDDEGVSVLLRARYRSDRALIEAVHARLSSLDIFEAASLGDLDRLVQLLGADGTVVASRSGDGFTPLHLAAFFGQEEATTMLLAHGAPVDALGTGWMTGTPLHSAASGSHPAVVRRLLEAGADPNARQSGGWTPLHSAAANGNAEVVRLLLDHGADPGAVNDDGASVRDLAATSGDGPTLRELGG